MALSRLPNKISSTAILNLIKARVCGSEVDLSRLFLRVRRSLSLRRQLSAVCWLRLARYSQMARLG